MSIKIFVGPMTKNVVDAVMEYCGESSNEIGFIPSRRQVSMDGGYVNNWSTKTFKRYVGSFFIVRDHGGPGQGNQDDDGIESLLEDCKYFNLLHIDPWKKYPIYEDGLRETIKLIKLCHSRNSDVFFEVGTEESIRRFSCIEVNNLLKDLKGNLLKTEFNMIKYCVIQSGTSLKENNNTGSYNKDRLINMCNTVKSYGMLSKEHNGDYLPASLIREKFSHGLDSINIAPEFGQIETKVYLEKIKTENPELLEVFWDICYRSEKWKKWVSKSFNPIRDKEKLINICGHYVLSKDEFVNKIKNNLSSSDKEIISKIKNKLEDLFNEY